jgi:glycosyltransferase involved in cell wall biosynthesis
MVTSLMGVSGNLLIDSQCGILYSAEDSDDLTVKLRNLFLDPKRIELMSSNARNLYLEKFEYQKIYGELVNHLVQLARK